MKDTLVDFAGNMGVFVLTLLFQLALSSFIIWLSWNSLIPNLFTTLREISFGEAVTLYVLFSALFKSSVTSPSSSSTEIKGS